jgi:ubiquitin carboxyl-terminal hydrolase 34
MLRDTPNVLLVHLKRIVFSFDTFNNVKINSKLEFPHILDLRPYSVKGISEKEGTTEAALADPSLAPYISIDDD